MELQALQRQRIKQYKWYLKQEIQKKNSDNRNKKNYHAKQDNEQINEMMDRINEEDKRRLNDRKNTALLLRQHNNQINEYNKSRLSNSQQYSLQDLNSFENGLHNIDAVRTNKLKQNYRIQKYENYNQIEENKKNNQHTRQIQREQDKQHLKRISQMNEESQRNYYAQLQKHSQNMNLYKQHEKLMDQNEKYRQAVEKFTDTDKNMLNHICRDESEKRKNIYRYNQQQLKKQMEEFNHRKSLEKSQILAGHELEKSMLGSLLHDDSYDKRQYGQILKSQIEQQRSKRKSEDKSIKQKYYINGIYGGQHGNQRKKQIEYIDKKLGIMPKDSHHNYSLDKYNSSKKNSTSFGRESSTAMKQASQIFNNKKSNESPEENIYQEPQKNTQQSIERALQMPKIPNSPRLFRSYDVVSGHNKFYETPSR